MLTQVNRRTVNAIRTSWPPNLTSANRRTQRPSTVVDQTPHAPHAARTARTVRVAASILTPTALTTTASNRRPTRCGSSAKMISTLHPTRTSGEDDSQNVCQSPTSRVADNQPAGESGVDNDLALTLFVHQYGEVPEPSVSLSLEEALQSIRSAPQASDPAMAAVAEAAVGVLARLERWPELVEVASAGVFFAGPENPSAALRLMHNCGIGQQYLDKPALAAQTFTLVARLAGEVGMPDLRAQALAHLGQVLLELHEPEQAIDALHQAVAIFRGIGDRLGEARCYGNLASIVAEFDDEDLALRYTEDARAIFVEIGDRSGEARTLVTLAEDAAENGDFELAIELLSAAIELFDAAHEPARAGYNAFTAARLARIAGDDRLAVQ